MSRNNISTCCRSSRLRGDMVKDTSNLRPPCGGAEEVCALSVSVNVVRCRVSVTVKFDRTEAKSRSGPYLYARHSLSTKLHLFVSSGRHELRVELRTSGRVMDLLVNFPKGQPHVRFVDVLFSLLTLTPRLSSKSYRRARGTMFTSRRDTRST